MEGEWVVGSANFFLDITAKLEPDLFAREQPGGLDLLHLESSQVYLLVRLRLVLLSIARELLQAAQVGLRMSPSSVL